MDEKHQPLTLPPLPRSFDLAMLLRSLYQFVAQLAALVEELRAELAALKAEKRSSK